MTTSPDYTRQQACGIVWAWTNNAPVAANTNHCMTSTKTHVRQMARRVPAKSALLQSGQRRLQAAHQNRLPLIVRYDGNTVSSGEPQTRAKFGYGSTQRHTPNAKETKHGVMHGQRSLEQCGVVFSYLLRVRVAG